MDYARTKEEKERLYCACAFRKHVHLGSVRRCTSITGMGAMVPPLRAGGLVRLRLSSCRWPLLNCPAAVQSKAVGGNEAHHTEAHAD